MSLAFDRIQPHSEAAEQSVLGSMILSDEAIARVEEILQPEDFYHENHRDIFKCVLNLYRDGQAVDLVTLSEELKRCGLLEKIGGITYLAEVAGSVPSAANAEDYAEIVRTKATLRNLARAAHRILNKIYQPEESLQAIVEEAEREILEVSGRRTIKGFTELKEVLDLALDRIEFLYSNKGQITGTPTGFADFDAMTSGLHPSEFIVIAARPSMGKTQLALNIARYAAVEKKKAVALFSLEMPAEQLAMRLLAAEATIDSQRLRNGHLTEDHWKRLGHALARLSEAPIYIDDTSGLSLNEIRARTRRIQQEHKLDMILIDYLQLMSGGTGRRTENRQQEISEISRGLKGIARDLNVPVVALSQLSRAVESRQDKRPMLSDLRECLTGDTLVALASGELKPIEDLVGLAPEVLTLDGWRISSGRASRVWCVGERPVYQLTLRSGRTIRATANHPFRCLDGWVALEALRPGHRVAIPRRYPAGRGVEGRLAGQVGNTNIDTVPKEVWRVVRERMRFLGVTQRQMAQLRGTAYGGTSHYQFAPSRSVLSEYAALLRFAALRELADADVFWDEVRSIEPDGVAPVFDMEVPGSHNFVANGMVVHNSGAIEQDADLVCFIYRDDYYNPDSEKPNIAEVIIAKQRNGPVGKLELVFMKEFGKFVSLDKKHLD